MTTFPRTFTADELMVLHDALSELDQGIQMGAYTPWEDYDGGGALDPKLNPASYRALLSSARHTVEMLLNVANLPLPPARPCDRVPAWAIELVTSNPHSPHPIEQGCCSYHHPEDVAAVLARLGFTFPEEDESEEIEDEHGDEIPLAAFQPWWPKPRNTPPASSDTGASTTEGAT